MPMFRPLSLGLGLLLLGACGPLMRPMFERITPEAQAHVNTEWNNMLSTPDRLDRETLLEVIADAAALRTGITRGTFYAEKSDRHGHRRHGHHV